MEKHATTASQLLRHAFEFSSVMSFWVAHNIGAKRIARVLSMLNNGQSLAEIAAFLGVSISRASRIVRALYKRVYVPHDWTIDAITFESDNKIHEAREAERECQKNLTLAKEYAETMKELTGRGNGEDS